MTGLRNERGQMLSLVIGFTMVLFAVAGVAVDGAKMWLLRRGLQATADAAALAAAARLDVNAFYETGGASARLDPSAAVDEGREVLDRRGLASRSRISIEGNVVRARVSGRLRTSFLSLIGVDELPVVAEATATPVFGEAP